MIREVEKPSLSDLLGIAGPKLASELLRGITLVGSGKGAIALVLRYLREHNVLQSKLDEVLVPDWLGYWVYNQIQSYAFPAKRFSQRSRALFVYHQYGFPQDMDKILEFADDKKLLVIEDCAHAIKSFYKGRRLGFLGDFAIFSFSKWFFCYALGGVRGPSSAFADFVDSEVRATKLGLTVLKDSAKFFHEFTIPKSQISYANLFLRASYAIYQDALKPSLPAKRLLAQKLEEEIRIREERYKYFLKKTDRLGICEHLETTGLAPYVIPIIPNNSRIQNIVEALRSQEIDTGIYQFDVNRNLLEPKFIPSVLIPCHSGMSSEQFDLITETVIKSHGH